MPTGWIVFFVILGILVVGFIVLAIVGRKMQKKQEASNEQIRQGAQLVSMLVIEKKRVKLTEAGFPQVVIDQTPKYLRRAKVPVVKAKIGPKVASLMCDDKAFPLIPEKREVKVLMNGIYIIEAKSARGGLDTPPAKKTFTQKLRDKAASLSSKNKTEETAKKSKKKK